MNETYKSISDLRKDFLNDLDMLNQITLDNELDTNIAANILDIVESLLSYDYVFIYAEYADGNMEKLGKAPKVLTDLINKLYVKETDANFRKFIKKRV